MWFIGVEVEHETSAPPPKKYPGSAPEPYLILSLCVWITVRNKSFQYVRMETSKWEKLTKASGKKKHEKSK